MEWGYSAARSTQATIRALLILGLGTSMYSQSLSSISGVVRDAQKGTIAGVSVTLARDSGQQTVTTDAAGQYRFDAVTPGPAELTFSAAGFETTRRTAVLTDQPSVLDVLLEVSNMATSVLVSETADKATASRMPIPDREIPVQVSSVPQQVLEEQGVNDMVTALRNVSGATAFRSYGMYEYYTIRGFNTANVVLVDGMRLEGNRLNSQMNNVERVEVLKGPASVLYGGQALSGSINIVRKKPQAQPVFDFFYRGGRFHTHQGGAGAAGQIGSLSSLLYRADISFESADAWRGAAARRLNISPAITWIPGERLRMTITQAFNRDNFDGDAGVPVGVLGRQDYKASWRFNTPWDFAANRDSQTNALFTFALPHDLQLRNSFLYRWADDEYFTAESLAYQPALNQVARQYLYFKHHRRPVLNQADITGTFRLAGMKHTFLAGYEYQDYYNFTYRSASRSVAATPINLSTFAETQPPVTDFPLSRVDNFSNRINAMFWQDQISLTERIHVNIGGRFDDYLSRLHNDPWADGQRVSRTPDSSRHQTAYTYRAGLVYAFAPSQQAYFSSSSSFQPVSTIPADGRELNPETGRSLEFGHRWQGFQDRLQISTAAWYLVRQNVVIALGNQQFDQAGQQSAKGIDFDATGRIGHGLLLVANYGYALPRYDEYFTANGTVNLSGFRPRFTQRHAANLWLTRQWNSGIYASAGTRYVSSMYTSDLNEFRLGGWTVISGAVGIRKSIWEWSLNAENLFNRGRYFLPASIANQVYPGQPINVFTTLRFRFRP